MKSIGETFKEKRQSIDLKISEVANDLDVSIAQLENLEDGNINAFKDIFFLKDLIKRYAVYLNVDEEKMLNEFNEYVFDYTSKIPVKELEEKMKEIQAEEKDSKRISSPYTEQEKLITKINPVFIFLALALMLAIIIIIIVSVVKSDIEKNQTISVGGSYEFTEQNYNC